MILGFVRFAIISACCSIIGIGSIQGGIGLYMLKIRKRVRPMKSLNMQTKGDKWGI